VLEDDNIFLHYQGETLSPNGVQDPDWRQRLYVPTSSDAAVVHYHRWLDKFAGGGVSWARDRPAYVPADRKELIERFHSHTEHCSSCTELLAISRNARRAADVGILLGLLAAACLDEFKLPCAAASLVAAGLKAVAEDTESKLTSGEYPPPRNQS